MSVSITVEAGAGPAQGSWARTERDQVVLILDRAYAPGAPLTLRGELEGASLSVMAKTIGSKRRPDGFEVRAKLLGVTRGDRERIARAFGLSPSA